MVFVKFKKLVGFGNLLMNDCFGKGKGFDCKRVLVVICIDYVIGQEYIINDRQEVFWVKMCFIIEQGVFDEFFVIVELVGIDFIVEKMSSVKIIYMD